ncbi:MAG: cob(I)yrinic acid a,c-diamide adenosyltransferase [Planctomycetes bacterium]|nr:cob(I)yrinic acid a,c-diamide adenosyltransferase [Planctomycetota bacterium]
MPRITRVYTRTGDDGRTNLGGGQRVSKDSARIEAYGTVDELNSTIGVAIAMTPNTAIADALRNIQNELFHLGSDLCILEEDKQKMPVPTIQERHVAALETLMDKFTEELEPLANFILPGGTPGAAQLHVARCVCRRAERNVVTLSHSEPVGAFTVIYLNRLSDALFVMARYENKTRNINDPVWDSRR